MRRSKRKSEKATCLKGCFFAAALCRCCLVTRVLKKCSDASVSNFLCNLVCCRRIGANCTRCFVFESVICAEFF